MLKKQDIKAFLKETRYCDCKNPEIQELARQITKPYNTDREKAIALFEYVRDTIKYQFGYWGKRASQTFREGRGMCTNKANLLIALLRATKIPAGYGIMKVNAKEYFGPVMLPVFKKLVSATSVHIYTYVFLDNKWIKCDPSTDKELSDKTSYFNPTTKLVVWDGRHNRLDNINPAYIYKDDGPYANIDDQLDKKARHAKGIPLKIGNLYLDFLRESTEKMDDIQKPAKKLEALFRKWLRLNHFFYFLSYSILCRIYAPRI